MAEIFQFNEIIMPFLSKISDKTVKKISSKLQKKTSKFLVVDEMTIINLSRHNLNDKAISKLNKMFGKITSIILPLE